jgi:hypothetical protein
MNRPEVPNFETVWRFTRVKAKGECRLRELNRIESGVVGIRPFGVDRMPAKVARGGALMGKPRCARILAIRGGCSMAAMIVKVPPLLKDTARCR